MHAFGGEPGVYTADWEGPTRDAMVGMKRIQDEFAGRGVPDTDDRARATFHCVLALAWPDEHVELVHGTLDGRIVWPPRGSGGHGYDPCFQPLGDRAPPPRCRPPRRTRSAIAAAPSPSWSRPAFDDAPVAPLGVYVHWPFCKSKCPYCDFNSHVRDGVEQARWRTALLTELEHAAREAPDRRVETMFFGGGTPSLMEPETVGAVIARTRAALGHRAGRRDHAGSQPDLGRGGEVRGPGRGRRQSRVARRAGARSGGARLPRARAFGRRSDRCDRDGPPAFRAAVAEFLQHISDHHPDHDLVFDEKHRIALLERRHHARIRSPPQLHK